MSDVPKKPEIPDGSPENSPENLPDNLEGEIITSLRKILLQDTRLASTSPGVYLMKDRSQTILYIGKAKNLKNRLQTYFRGDAHDCFRIERMIQQVDHFDTILTETEAEALILECTLIKKHKPKYNVMLKDDKTYPYIRIDLSEEAPRLIWTRKVKKDGARYFGPFPSSWSAKQVLYLLNERFKLRDCSDNTYFHRSRPCILYQLNRCSAPCVKKISLEDYRSGVDRAILVLEGKELGLITELENEMQAASEAEDFERASVLRDQLQNIKMVTETQGMIEPGIERNRDVIGIARQDALGQGVVLQIRHGKLVGVHHYTVQNSSEEMSQAEILAEFLAHYYLMDRAKLHPHADDVLVSEVPVELEILEQALGVAIKLPEKKEELQLLNIAMTNARYTLETLQKKDQGHGIKSLEEVQKKLKLSQLPLRIECYDISNVQGEEAVGSRVVFIEGAPMKAYYRRYKIKTVEGQNDFAMMKEILGRRFLRSSVPDDVFPQLLVVDGGKGQLAQAVAILDELGIQGVEVASLAKARTESDFQADEVETSSERVFIPGRKNPLPLNAHSSAYRLLVHLRDEAHRFAVSYHRLRRTKKHL